MENLRMRAKAAERATQKAKDDLNEARDNRSRISAKLDEYEHRLRTTHRGRDHEKLRRKYDTLQERLIQSRAEVRRALDAHAELSERSLDLLDRMVEAEDAPRPGNARPDSRSGPTYTTRTTYHYSSTNGTEQRESSWGFHSGSGYERANDPDGNYTRHKHGRSDSEDSRGRFNFEEHYTTEEHVPQSRRRHHHKGRAQRNSHDRFEREEDYTTEEHVPRSHRRHHERSEPDDRYDDSGYSSRDENDSYHPGYSPSPPRRTQQPYHPGFASFDHYEQHYTTEEHVPQSERAQHGETRGAHRNESSSHYPRPEHHHHYESPPHYTTEEHEPKTSRRAGSDGPGSSHRRTSRDDNSSRNSGRSTPRTEQGHRAGNNNSRSDRSVPPRPQNDAPQPTRLPSQQTVDSWWKYTNDCFKDYTKITQFPMPPALSCGKLDCDAASATRPLAACECNIRASFGMVRNLNVKRERLRWHPDKFTACPANLRESFQKMASEVFIVLDKMHKEE